MPSLRLHHVNLTSMVPSAMWDFYVTKLGLDDDPDHWTPPNAGFDDNRFCKIGDFEIHLSRTDPELGARFGQPFNPLLRGHIAFEIDDLEAMKDRLRKHGILFADYGTELGGRRTQLFVADPSGRVVELRDAPER